jgi:cytochrome c553
MQNRRPNAQNRPLEAVESAFRFISRRWHWLLGGAAAVIAAEIAGAILIAWTGIYDASATSHHSSIAHWFLHFTMRHSVAFHSSDATPPALGDPARILRGAKHYEMTCSPCHGAPDHPALDVTRGMTPPPPPLYDARAKFDPEELHWVVKHGIKMTAMPAWPALQRNDEIWDMVAFLEQLPDLNPDRYGKLVEAKAPFEPAVLQGSMTGCAFCHGADGGGRGGAFPRIAGLSAGYIEKSLQAFKDGSRPSGFMLPVARAMTDQQMKEAAQYFSAMPRNPSSKDSYSSELLQRGAQIARPELALSAPACLTCHVQQDASRASDVPNLAGQSAWYLADQLRLFRSGVRAGSDAARVMARYARELSDNDIEAVSAYLSTLQPSTAAAAAANP